jgi:hypothetical protein
MIRWIIASYIVLVLVLSAKATAHIGLESNPTINKFNYQSESSEKLHVQDPLPNVGPEDSDEITLDSISENFVG